MAVTFTSADLEADESDIYFYTDDSDAAFAPNLLGTNDVLSTIGNQSEFTVPNPSNNKILMDTNVFFVNDHLGIPNYDAYVTFSSTGTLPAPLLPDTIYKGHNASMDAVPTSAQSKITDLNDNIIDITDAGTGIHTVTLVATKYLDKDNTGISGPSLEDALGRAVGNLPDFLHGYEIFWWQSSDYYIQIVTTFDYANIYVYSKEGVDFTYEKVKNLAGFEIVAPAHPFRLNDKVRLTGMGLPSNFTDGGDYYLKMKNGDKWQFLDAPNGNVIPVNTDFDISSYPIFHVEELETRAVTVVGHGFYDGEPVTLTTDDTLPTPLEEGRTYTVRVIDEDTIYFSTSKSIYDAVYMLVGSGVGNHTITSSALKSLDALMLAKFRAYPGVPDDLSYDMTLRKYFIERSGVAEDRETPTSFYMHVTFDNEGIPEGIQGYRFRKLFIQESAATDDMSWQDAARIWAETP